MQLHGGIENDLAADDCPIDMPRAIQVDGHVRRKDDGAKADIAAIDVDLPGRSAAEEDQLFRHGAARADAAGAVQVVEPDANGTTLDADDGAAIDVQRIDQVVPGLEGVVTVDVQVAQVRIGRRGWHRGEASRVVGLERS